MWHLSFARAIKQGTSNFLRSGWLSFTATMVMALTLFTISFILFLFFVYTRILNDIEDQISINVYFDNQTGEEQILEIKNEIETIPDVEKVEYVSREQNLQEFIEQNKEDELAMESLEQFEGNPLNASLALNIKNPQNIERIESELIAGKYKEFIVKTDYSDNRATIEKMNDVVNATRKIGVAISIVLILIAVLVSFNSIRLTMYTHKTEIEIMRLVGANNWFIRMPFVTEGAMYGLLASLIVFIIWYPLAVYISPLFESAQISIDPVKELNHNILIILPLQIFIGFSLGIISSFLAIRRYLR